MKVTLHFRLIAIALAAMSAYDFAYPGSDSEHPAPPDPEPPRQASRPILVAWNLHEIPSPRSESGRP